MIQSMQIDFVSDVSCPWCAIGLHSLEAALARTRDVVDAEIRFEPFELNPAMPAGGQNIVEHVAEKYGSSREESEADRAVLRARAADIGFDMPVPASARIYNTHDAHRLLHWAFAKGFQSELKHRLFEANFSHGLDISDRQVLATVAASAGLDPVEAEEILRTGRFALETAGSEDRWRSRGIDAVPAVVINDEHLLSGAQSVATFERAIRRIAAQR